MHDIFVAGPRGRDRIVVGLMKSVPITIRVVSLNHTRGVLDTTLWDKVCQCLAAVSTTNKIDRHDINEIHVVLKVAINTITLTPNHKTIKTALRRKYPTYKISYLKESSLN